MNNYRLFKRNKNYNYQEIGILALNLKPYIGEHIFFSGALYQIENIEHVGPAGSMITNLYCNQVDPFKK